jgi:ParB-like chromosome segregation protein Spo0J
MTNTLDLHVEYISVDHVIPYQYNARTHSDDQVAQIAGSMTEFGFVNPILIDDNGGIIAGHGRLMAARMLGVKRFPPFA